MGGKCCKKTTAVPEAPAAVVEKAKDVGEGEKLKAAEMKDAKMAEAKAEGEKLKEDIGTLEGKIQDKKDAGCVRDQSPVASKENVLSRDSSASDSAASESASGA